MAKVTRPKPGEVFVAPSILSADFSKLGDEINEVESAGADWIHVDVMDGHFVPNVTIGPVVVRSIRPVTELPLDCHLMVSEPEKWIDDFVKAGASCITVHVEATQHLDRLLNQIRQKGCLAGVSLNPATPVQSIQNVLDLADLVLVMSVNPGFGGQSFIPYSVDKVKELKALRGDRNYLIEIDGGVGPNNAQMLKEAGVDVFVAGSSVFGKTDRKAAIEALK